MIEGLGTETGSTFNEIAARAKSQYRTVEEMAASVIREAIVSGAIPPGTKLHQSNLAEALEVSRIPVRQAIRRLEAEGLVAIFPHRGAVVRSIEPEELREIYELRVMLETFVLREAMKNITPEEVDELDEMAAQLDTEPEGGHWVDTRRDFYRRLYQPAERPRTLAMIESLRADVGRYWLSLRVVDRKGTAHRKLVEAIRAQDAEAAERWLADHLEHVSDELSRLAEAETESVSEAR
ncbi:MAG TPA: GntR family transcriptional regulator [Acidimicrobiia bacterium]|nr:GntR family transcriptional regulator [Acidimicrobiia bacterium]